MTRILEKTPQKNLVHMIYYVDNPRYTKYKINFEKENAAKQFNNIDKTH